MIKISQFRSLLKHSQKFNSQGQQFWQINSEKLIWFEKPQTIMPNENNKYKWFQNGKINMAYNCLERTCAASNVNEQPAIIYANIQDQESGYVSYKQLKKKVAIFSKKLQKLGLKKGDKVIIYLPHIIQSAEAILACSALGIVFEFIIYGLGTISLKNSIQEIQPKLIITTSCTIESDGIHQNKIFIDKAKEELNLPDLKCLIIQRKEKKILELQKGDIEFDQIDIDKNDFEIEYAFTDSNDPLYIFNAFSYTKNYIRTHKLLREIGSHAVGLEYSMMRHLGIFQGDSILTSANFSSSLGLSYGLFGPFLRGATTMIMEDPMVFFQNPDIILRNNNIKTLYIHSEQVQKIYSQQPNFLENCQLDFIFLQDKFRDQQQEFKFIKDCQKNQIQVNGTFFNQELGVVAACEDWQETKRQKQVELYPADQIELFDSKFEQSDINFLYIKNTYPGLFTTFLNARRGKTHPTHFYSQEFACNTFQQGKIENNQVILKKSSDLDTPYNVIQGVQILKKQIISELIKIEKIHFVYIMPIIDSEESSFVIFLEVNDELIKSNQAIRDEFFDQIRKQMQNSIGDIFDLDEILIFSRLPKRIKHNGSIGVDKYQLRKLLDSDYDGKLFNKKQEIFDFKNLLNSLQKNNQL